MKTETFAIILIAILFISGCISQQTKQSFAKDIERSLQIFDWMNKSTFCCMPQNPGQETGFQIPADGSQQPEPKIQDTGLKTQDSQSKTPNSGPETQNAKLPIGCDNICDDFEKQVKEQSPCYNPDCLGIKNGNETIPKTVNQQSIQPQQPQQGMQQFNSPPQMKNAEIQITKTNSTYKIADTDKKPSGWFSSGQSADIMLSGIDFNNSGGPLLFNHPGTIASDGTHLLLADRNNNRVLIWNKLPKGNEEPNLVLGQKNFYTNNPGNGLNEFNWPVAVAVSPDGKVIVADTYNDRILIWNKFPTKNGQTADLVIQDIRSEQGTQGPGLETQNSKRNLGWPWAVWTDGKKLIVTSTATGSVLIWNSFPTKDNQAADIRLTANGKFGTPRSIGSDGKHLIIGDHNAKLFTGSDGGGQGTFFWKTFPTKDDQPYDFAMKNAGSGHGMIGEELWAAEFLEDGKLMAIGESIYVWNGFPENENDKPDLTIGYPFKSNSGSGIIEANGTLYIASTNGNMIWGYGSVPKSAEQKPDFVIGSKNMDSDPLAENYFMTNPVPLTDGKSLVVVSDFDRKMYVWKNIPDESGAKPDFVHSNVGGPWGGALFNGVLAIGGKRGIYIWNKIPLNGEKPDTTINEKIGSVEFKEIRGIAIDEKYFYVADNKANKIYVWKGIPTENAEPVATISTDRPFRLSSNGKYLAVVKTYGPTLEIYKISELGTGNAKPSIIGGAGIFNLPEGALLHENSLFVADTVFNRVHIWKNVEDALDGKSADTILGNTNTDQNKLNHPEIGKNKLFWPAAIAFDGNYLWVGEFKFSGRLLRFSVK